VRRSTSARWSPRSSRVAGCARLSVAEHESFHWVSEHGRGSTPEPSVTLGGRRLGFIGLGIMGQLIAHNLLRAGYRVVGHSRIPGLDHLVA
jgi:phosphoglycerate dehydrogenase-like enzyme